MIANLLGSSSGLVRWRDETRRGREELGATRSAIKDINANLDRLVGLGSRAEESCVCVIFQWAPEAQGELGSR